LFRSEDGTSALADTARSYRDLQDVQSCEDTQETLALLKLLALGRQDIDAGRTRPLAEAVERLRNKHTRKTATSERMLSGATRCC
jgi:hypothetical protein